MKQEIRYEVVGRATVESTYDRKTHALNLLYRGDGTPWWVCSASLNLPVPEDFPAKPGDTVLLTVEVVR